MEQKKTSKHGYDAIDIQILEGHEAVRFRPGMYISATDYRALPVLVEYLIDGLSQVYRTLGQAPERITIRFEKDGSATLICGGPTLDEAFLEQYAPLLQKELSQFTRFYYLFTLQALSERLSATIRAPRGQWRTLLFERGLLRGDESHASAPDPNCDVWLRFWPDFTILEPAAFDVRLTREKIDASFPAISHLITLVDARS